MFRTLLYRLMYRLMRDDITAYAAQITFYMILSIFPFLVFLGRILARTNLTTIVHLLEVLTDMKTIPGPVVELLSTVLSSLQITSDASYSLYIVVIIYSASKCIRGIMNGIHMAYHTVETRSLPVRFLLSFFYTICFAIVIVLFIALVLFGEQLSTMFFGFFGLDAFYAQLMNLLRYMLPVIFMFITYMLLYRIIPAKPLKFHNVYIGALFSTVTSFIVSRVFSIYVSDFSNYATLYGSISGIIIVLLWLYLISLILLLGAMLNATIDELD